MEKLIYLLVDFHDENPFIFWIWLFMFSLALFFFIVGLFGGK